MGPLWYLYVGEGGFSTPKLGVKLLHLGEGPWLDYCYWPYFFAILGRGRTKLRLKSLRNARLQGSARDLSQRPPGLAIGGVGTERGSCARLRGNCSLARGSGRGMPGNLGALSVVSREASQMVCIGGDCELLHPVTNGLLSPSFRISARFEEAAPDLRSG
jgi:hypothetical protein